MNDLGIGKVYTFTAHCSGCGKSWVLTEQNFYHPPCTCAAMGAELVVEVS